MSEWTEFKVRDNPNEPPGGKWYGPNRNEETKMTTNYPIEETAEKKIERTFSYHPPNGDQRLRYDVLRDRFKALAFTLVNLTPVSREQSVALTHLETALMFANAAIARNEHPETKPAEKP